MNQKYVVVINKKDDITPLRHIITLHHSYDEEEFKNWYYSQYCELEGDTFVCFPTRKTMEDYLNALN